MCQVVEGETAPPIAQDVEQRVAVDGLVSRPGWSTRSPSLLGPVGLAYVRYDGRLALTEAEREWLAYRDDRTDFDDWISTIRLPEEARDLPVAEADTLADLVDFATDTDNAVLESADGERSHVVHDGYRYTFEAPPDPTRTPEERETTGTGEQTTETDEQGTTGDRTTEVSVAPDGEGTAAVASAVESEGEADGDAVTDRDDDLTLRGVGPTYAAELREAGIEHPADLLEADTERVTADADIPPEGVGTLVGRARELVDRSEAEESSG